MKAVNGLHLSAQRIIDSGALKVIKEWVAKQDIETYKSSFVWTTLEPLVDLLGNYDYHVYVMKKIYN